MSMLPLLMTCCAHKAVMPALVPTAPPVAVAVVPTVTAVQKSQQTARAAGEKLESQVGKFSGDAATLRKGLQDATVEADRLRKQKSATEADLDKLWAQLNELTQRNMFLETEALEAVKTANDQRLARVEVEKQLEAALRAAEAKDAEAASLRLQNADLGQIIKDQGGKIDSLNAATKKAEANAAIGGYLKGCIWFIGIMLFMAHQAIST